jgi:hypothetical protein
VQLERCSVADGHAIGRCDHVRVRHRVDDSDAIFVRVVIADCVVHGYLDLDPFVRCGNL